MPEFIEPCHPTLHENPPTGEDWLYEIKIDGYRVQLHIRDGAATAFTRRGHDWSDQFGTIIEAARGLKVREAILDGEATVIGSTGLPDFQALRRELAKRNSPRVIYHAFDLLYLDGRDLRGAPLIERKSALRTLLDGAPTALAYVDFLQTDGDRVFDHACRMGLEGVVAKRASSPYRSGRQENWIKLKCIKTDSFPIVAFVEKLGARPRKIASLYIGRWDGDRLLYAGKARTGYTEAVAREVRERLDPLIMKRSPLSQAIKKPKATWVEPTVHAEIEYSGITDDGLLRAAVFRGLRDDLGLPRRKAPALVPHSPEKGKGVPAENILQLLPDAVAPSKADLIAYWRKVAKRALVHLAGRPLKLVRHTQGTTFYHKGKLPPIPQSVHQLRIQKREGGEGVRVWIDDLAGLLGLAEMDAVELHPWNATVDDIERADRIVIDLDPGPGVEWNFVIETALRTRQLLEAEGLDSWPKLTGGKGLHIMAPLKKAMSHDAARRHARKLVERLARADPRRYVLSSAPQKRTGRVFLDYLRNGRGNTAIGAYSPRARAGWPIAAPVTWTQIERGIAPDAFTMTKADMRAVAP